MLEIVFFLIIDTFIIVSLNDDSLKDNLKHYFGIETSFAIIGFLIGNLILNYINKNLFYYLIALLIVVVQIIDVMDVKLPKIITPLLLGVDSLFVFTTMSIIAIPILTIFEFVAITIATYVGDKIIYKLPYRNYISNLVMVIIAIELIL